MRASCFENRSAKASSDSKLLGSVLKLARSSPYMTVRSTCQTKKNKTLSHLHKDHATISFLRANKWEAYWTQRWRRWINDLRQISSKHRLTGSQRTPSSSASIAVRIIGACSRDKFNMRSFWSEHLWISHKHSPVCCERQRTLVNYCRINQNKSMKFKRSSPVNSRLT